MHHVNPSTFTDLSVVQTEAIACAHIVSSVVQSIKSQREWLARGLRFNNIIRKFCSCVSKTRTKKEVYDFGNHRVFIKPGDLEKPIFRNYWSFWPCFHLFILQTNAEGWSWPVIPSSPPQNVGLNPNGEVPGGRGEAPLGLASGMVTKATPQM